MQQSMHSYKPLRGVLHSIHLHSFGYSVTSDNHYISLHPQMTKKHCVLLAVQTVCEESTVAA